MSKNYFPPAYNRLERGIKYGSLDEVNKAIEEGVDVNMVFYGRTLIGQASDSPDPRIFIAFMKAGGDINFIDGRGETALFSKVINLQIEKVKLLLKYGADPTIKNKLGLTVFDYLNKALHDRYTNYNSSNYNTETINKITTIIQLLKSAMARKRWKKLKGVSKMLSVHKRAALSANSPERLIQLGIFDNPEKFDQYFKPASFGKKLVKRSRKVKVKIPTSIKILCRKLKIRLTKKVNGRRVYKPLKLLKKQIKLKKIN